MRKKLVIAVAALLLNILPRPSLASGSMLISNPEHLEGKNILVASIDLYPGYELLNSHVNTKVKAPLTAVVETLHDEFSKQQWLSIRSERDYSPSVDMHQPNILLGHFDLTTRMDWVVMFGVIPKHVKVASLSFELLYSTPDPWPADWAQVHFPKATYAFVVPEDHDEFLAKLSEGVRFLTSFLPDWMECTRKSRVEMISCIMQSDAAQYPYGAVRPRSGNTFQ